ncbi:MAG: polymer-forming cytoskeletal protein [Verrucomicrobia bacterium]|nr:polymer-forming cytoskeletal protein [Verrucomicrobiota bacterium]
MFKKKLESAAQQFLEELADRPTHPYASGYMQQEEVDEPETVIASGVEIQGSIRFQKLLRIDGTFEGEIHSDGKLIIGPTGCVTADLNLDEAFISGKIVGNIKVKTRLVLRGHAEVHGDIEAPLISVDEGVTLLGSLRVTQTPASV